jgi:hypothetical protein
LNIAIIDSGIHAGHPHVGNVAGGFSLVDGDLLDRLGHGTAVAGAIREKVPDAALFAVKIFDRRLSATIDTIVGALEWCREHRMDIANLSLGTANWEHRARFEEVLTSEMIIVSVAGMLPGAIAGVIAATPDPECPRDRYRLVDGVFHASPHPRPIPGVPPERNVQGASFAVANMTGFVAQALRCVSRKELEAELVRRAY